MSDHETFLGLPVVRDERVPPDTVILVGGRLPAMSSETTYQKLRNAVEVLVYQAKRNAVVILPLLVTVWQATDGLTLKDAIPVVVGIVLRQFFTSPTVDLKAERTAGLFALDEVATDQFHAGVVLGKVIGTHPSEVDRALPPELKHPLD